MTKILILRAKNFCVFRTEIYVIGKIEKIWYAFYTCYIKLIFESVFESTYSTQFQLKILKGLYLN